MRILTNNRSGGFGAATALSVGQGPTVVETGDLNGDLNPDLVVLRSASKVIAVLLGNGGGSSPPPPAPSPTPTPSPTPAPIVLSVAGTTTRPSRTVDLRWTGATGSLVTVNRNGAALAQTANDGQFTDTVSAKGTYRYTVCQPTPARCSNEVTVRFNK